MAATVVIPSNRSRKAVIPDDPLLYRHRSHIERCFGRLKHFRRFATRHDRRKIQFTGFIHLAAHMIWLTGVSIQPSGIGIALPGGVHIAVHEQTVSTAAAC
ncbi:hypothetical protein [Paracoccus lutimaris]|uniref:hypothetical protein n=1 Tax=Paracoccus lutimaris TaxID=1490030 RepID=UPI003CCC7897